jgi:hypothetical protein
VTPKPGWYDDAEVPDRERWWNGERWTDAVRWRRTPWWKPVLLGGAVAFGLTAILIPVTQDDEPVGESKGAPATATTTAPSANTLPDGQPAPPVIPELLPADVTVNAEDTGFDCDGPTLGELFATWDCTMPSFPVDFHVTVYGRQDTSLDVFQVEVSGPQDRVDVFGFFATLPFAGAEPEAARAWVEAKLPTVATNQPAEAVFGGVRFRVVGSGKAATLEVGHLA